MMVSLLDRELGKREHRVLEQVKSSALSLDASLIFHGLPDGNTKLANEHPILGSVEGSRQCCEVSNSWMDKNKTAMMWSAKAFRKSRTPVSHETKGRTVWFWSIWFFPKGGDCNLKIASNPAVCVLVC